MLRRGDAAANFSHPGDFSTVNPWKSLRRCNAADDGSILAYYGDNDYDDTGGNGQVCNYLEKFYYAISADEAYNITYSISDNPDDVDVNDVAVAVNPAFIYGSTNTPSDPKTVDYILVGSFLASATATHPTKLESKASTLLAPVTPFSSSPANLAVCARARNPASATPFNFLTRNQANGSEDGTVAADFQASNGAIVESSTLTAAGWPVEGSRSLKVTNPTPFSGSPSCAIRGAADVVLPGPNLTYTFSFWAYAPDNDGMNYWIAFVEGDPVLGFLNYYMGAFALSSTPTRYAFTTPFVSSGTTAYPMIGPWDHVAGAEVYFDEFQFEQFPAAYVYPDLPPGYTSITPGGAPSAWALPPPRSAQGWGMLTYRAYAAMQLLWTVENANFLPWQVPGMNSGLIATALSSNPAPTLPAYNGYTGSYGVQMGNLSGCYFPPSGTFAEMYGDSALPTLENRGTPCVPCYRGFELPWGGLQLAVEGVATDLSSGNMRLLVADDLYDWSFANYADAGINLGTPADLQAQGQIDDFVLGTATIGGVKQNWFFLARNPTESGGVRQQTYIPYTTQNTYPSPVYVGGHFLWAHHLFSYTLGYGTPNVFGTRIQFTPEGT